MLIKVYIVIAIGLKYKSNHGLITKIYFFVLQSF